MAAAATGSIADRNAEPGTGIGLLVRIPQPGVPKESDALARNRARAHVPAPDAWSAAMRAGNFERAWEISDRVLRRRVAAGEPCWHWPRHLQFIWSGVPLNGKRVLVRCYHGLGDTIQFIRFAAPLRAIAREVRVWAQPSLVPIVATAGGVDHVLPLHDGTVEADYDADVEIMELPHALRTTLESLPRQVPYLQTPDVSPDLSPCGPEFRIGIVWQAGAWHSVMDRVLAALEARIG